MILTDNPSEAEIQRIIDGIRDYGLAEVGGEKPVRKAAVLRDGDSLIGGAVGKVHVGRFYLDYLWVDAPYRNRKFGSLIHTRVIEQAKESNCSSIWVNTLNSNAVSFYLEHGYRVVGCIPDYVRNFDLHYLKLKL